MDEKRFQIDAGAKNPSKEVGMMKRLDFLRMTAHSAAGLFLAPDALELLVEPRRRYWPGADFGARQGRSVQLQDLTYEIGEAWQGEEGHALLLADLHESLMPPREGCGTPAHARKGGEPTEGGDDGPQPAPRKATAVLEGSHTTEHP